MSRPLLAASLLATLLAVAEARADIVDTTGMEPWEVCGLCHGLNGVSAMAKFPKLAGQPAEYIQKQLRAFRAERRLNDGGQMLAIATEVAEEDIEKVAAWFAGQEPPPPDAPPDDPALLARGEEIFLNGAGGGPACRACHAGAAPDGLIVPWLSAQHRSYLEKQLEDFASGTREGPGAGPMPEIAAGLSQLDREALAAYLSSSPRGGPETRRP